MALQVLVNTAWQQAATVLVTDLADAVTSDAAGIVNIVGGPQSLMWTQSSNTDRRVVYVNKSGGITVNYAVLVNAAIHNGHGVDFKSWSTYTSSATTISSSASFAGTLIGEKTKDYVLSLGSQASKQAIGVDFYGGSGGNYTKTLNKIFFSQAFALTYPMAMRFSSNWSSVLIRRQNYHVSELLEMVLEPLTKAEWQSLKGLYKITEEPFFLYDPDATRIHDGLWHCVTADLTAQPLAHDHYRVSWTVLRLRYFAA